MVISDVKHLAVRNHLVKLSHCLFEDSCVGSAFITACLQLLLKVKVNSIQIMLLGIINLFLNPEFPERRVEKLIFGIV